MTVTRRYVRRYVAANAGSSAAANAAQFLDEASNLSDLDSAATARTNLGAVAKTGDTMTGPLAVQANESGSYAISAVAQHASGHGFQMQTNSPSANAFAATAFGDNHHRLLVTTSARIEAGNGTDARDTIMERSAVGVWRVYGPFRVGQYSTGARPSASAAGAGAMIYDTTLHIPLWSDGTDWRDAAGDAA